MRSYHSFMLIEVELNTAKLNGFYFAKNLKPQLQYIITFIIRHLAAPRPTLRH